MPEYDHENMSLCMHGCGWVEKCQHSKPTPNAAETELRICHELLNETGIPYLDSLHYRLVILLALLRDAITEVE